MLQVFQSERHVFFMKKMKVEKKIFFKKFSWIRPPDFPINFLHQKHPFFNIFYSKLLRYTVILQNIKKRYL